MVDAIAIPASSAFQRLAPLLHTQCLRTATKPSEAVGKGEQGVRLVMLMSHLLLMSHEVGSDERCPDAVFRLAPIHGGALGIPSA
jgi:hypothetical protein